MQRPGAAEGHQGEVPRIVAALDRRRERPDHVLVTMSRMPMRPLPTKGRAAGDRSSKAGAPLGVEGDLAAESCPGCDPTPDEVGHRRLLAAGAVAAGPGRAPALSGPTVMRAVPATRRSTAARADRVNVEHRHVQRPEPTRPSPSPRPRPRGSGRRPHSCLQRRPRSRSVNSRRPRRPPAPTTPAAGPDSAV